MALAGIRGGWYLALARSRSLPEGGFSCAGNSVHRYRLRELSPIRPVHLFINAAFIARAPVAVPLGQYRAVSPGERNTLPNHDGCGWDDVR